MSFLSPWFLAGVLFIAGPIVAHLIRRTTRSRVSFSATRFLSPSMPRLDRRNRVQHPLLLLLRCLIVGALACAFARPFFHQDIPPIVPPKTPQSVVAVLDASASMNRAGLWDAAREKINDATASLGPDDQFALLDVSGGVHELVSREQWQQTPAPARAGLVRAVLANLQPGWGRKNLDSAIEEAVNDWEKMSESANLATRKKIIVVSDFTAGASVAGLSGQNWPNGCEVDLETVTPAHVGDAGLQWLGWTTDEHGGIAVRARVVQSAKSTVTALTVQLRDARTNASVGEPQHFSVQPGDAQVVVMPVAKDAAANPLRLDLAGDQESYDNTLWVVRPTPRQMTLAYFGNDTGNDIHHARFYLERAVAGWKDPVVHVVAGADAANIQPAGEVAVITTPLEAAAITDLRARLSAGAFAIVLLTDANMTDTAAALAGEAGWTPAPAAQSDALFGQIDFQHPLFSLFADPRYSDFTHIRFWHPQSVTLPANTTAVVAARFDDGTPAVMEIPVGRGRIVVWGGDWEPGASQWVLSTKFVPWLQSLFETAAGGALRPAVAEVGDAARLTGGDAARWRPLAAAEGAFADTTPEQPGIYQLEQNGVTRWVALQVPAAASNIAPLPFDTWEKLGVPLHAKAITDVAPLPGRLGENLTGEALEARQKLWRWTLLGAVFLLAVESIYSLALARRNDYNPNEASA
jgi:hypothetical protein